MRAIRKVRGCHYVAEGAPALVGRNGWSPWPGSRMGQNGSKLNLDTVAPVGNCALRKYPPQGEGTPGGVQSCSLCTATFMDTQHRGAEWTQRCGLRAHRSPKQHQDASGLRCVPRGWGMHQPRGVQTPRWNLRGFFFGWGGPRTAYLGSLVGCGKHT